MSDTSMPLVTPADTYRYFIESGAIRDYDWYMHVHTVDTTLPASWSVSFEDAALPAAERFTVTHDTIMAAVQHIADTSPENVTDKTVRRCRQVLVVGFPIGTMVTAHTADEVIQFAAFGRVRY